MKTGFAKNELPWEGRESLYEYVKNHLKGDTVRDQEPGEYFSGLSWEACNEPGLDDFLNLYEGGCREVNPKFINRLVDLFENYSYRGKLEYKVEFYNMLKNNPVNGYWDAFLNELSSRKIPIEKNGEELVRWMVRQAPDREVVKLGIIIMGILRNPVDMVVLTTMGKHQEFTSYVGYALLQMLPTWDLVLLDIIRPLFGYGRALAARQLLMDSEREEVRKWCVRYGFRNFVAPNFIMWDCVVQGDMLNELRQEKWDKPLVEATQMVVCSLTDEWEDDSHTYGGEIIYLYCKHTLGKVRGYVQYFLLEKLALYLKAAELNNVMITNLGFTDEEFSDVWIDVNKEIKKPWFLKLRANREPSIENPIGTSYLASRAFDELNWNKN